MSEQCKQEELRALLELENPTCDSHSPTTSWLWPVNWHVSYALYYTSSSKECNSFDFLRWLTQRSTTRIVTAMANTTTTITPTMAPMTAPERELGSLPGGISSISIMLNGLLQLLVKNSFLERIY